MKYVPFANYKSRYTYNHNCLSFRRKLIKVRFKHLHFQSNYVLELCKCAKLKLLSHNMFPSLISMFVSTAVEFFKTSTNATLMFT